LVLREEGQELKEVVAREFYGQGPDGHSEAGGLGLKQGIDAGKCFLRVRRG